MHSLKKLLQVTFLLAFSLTLLTSSQTSLAQVSRNSECVDKITNSQPLVTTADIDCYKVTLSASPSNCTIPVGSGTCSVSISWNSSNVYASIYISGPELRLNGLPATSWIDRGSVKTVNIPWINGDPAKTYRFFLHDANTQYYAAGIGDNIGANSGLDATALGSVNVKGTCASGSTWNGSICAAPVASGPTVVTGSFDCKYVYNDNTIRDGMYAFSDAVGYTRPPCGTPNLPPANVCKGTFNEPASRLSSVARVDYWVMGSNSIPAVASQSTYDAKVCSTPAGTVANGTATYAPGTNCRSGVSHPAPGFLGTTYVVCGPAPIYTCLGKNAGDVGGGETVETAWCWYAGTVTPVTSNPRTSGEVSINSGYSLKPFVSKSPSSIGALTTTGPNGGAPALLNPSNGSLVACWSNAGAPNSSIAYFPATYSSGTCGVTTPTSATPPASTGDCSVENPAKIQPVAGGGVTGDYCDGTGTYGLNNGALWRSTNWNITGIVKYQKLNCGNNCQYGCTGATMPIAGGTARCMTATESGANTAAVIGGECRLFTTARGFSTTLIDSAYNVGKMQTVAGVTTCALNTAAGGPGNVNTPDTNAYTWPANNQSCWISFNAAGKPILGGNINGSYSSTRGVVTCKDFFGAQCTIQFTNRIAYMNGLYDYDTTSCSFPNIRDAEMSADRRSATNGSVLNIGNGKIDISSMLTVTLNTPVSSSANRAVLATPNPTLSATWGAVYLQGWTTSLFSIGNALQPDGNSENLGVGCSATPYSNAANPGGIVRLPADSPANINGGRVTQFDTTFTRWTKKVVTQACCLGKETYLGAGFVICRDENRVSSEVETLVDACEVGFSPGGGVVPKGCKAPVVCTASQYLSGAGTSYESCVNFDCAYPNVPTAYTSAYTAWKATSCKQCNTPPSGPFIPVTSSCPGISTCPAGQTLSGGVCLGICTNGNAAQNGTLGATTANRYVQVTSSASCPASASACTASQVAGNICPTLGTSCTSVNGSTVTVLTCANTTCGDNGIRTGAISCLTPATNSITGTGGNTWIGEVKPIKFTPSIAASCGVYGSNGSSIDTSVVIRSPAALPAGNEQTVTIPAQYLSSVGAKGFYVQCTPASAPVFTSGVITINVYGLPTANIKDATSTMLNYGTVKTESTCTNSSTSTIEYRSVSRDSTGAILRGAYTPVTGYSNFTIPTPTLWTTQTVISDQLPSNYPGKEVSGKTDLFFVSLTCKSSAGGTEKIANSNVDYGSVLVKAIKDTDGDLTTNTDRTAINLPTGYYASSTLYYPGAVNSSITSASSSLYWTLPVDTKYKVMVDNMPANYQFLGIATSSRETVANKIFTNINSMSPSTVEYTGSDTWTVFYSEKLPTASIVTKKINCPFDIDGDGYITETDAMLFTRFALGVAGTGITNGVTFKSTATRTTATEIISFINAQVANTYDLDGNGSVQGLTDGIIFTRYVRGFQSGLTTGALGTGATRTTFDAIDSYIDSKCADGNALLHTCRNSTGYKIISRGNLTTNPPSIVDDQGYSQEFVDAVKAKVAEGAAATGNNNQYDLNNDGNITGTDVNLAKANINLTSPTPKDFSTTTDPYDPGLKYTLTCYGAQDTTPANATIDTYSPITITATSSPMIKTMSDAPLTWNSTANTCQLYDFDGATKIGSVITGQGASSPYSFNYTLSTTSPMYRTELNSTHLDINTPPNSLGYKIKCFDTAKPARGTTTSPIKVQVYKPTVATITGPSVNGNIDLRCTSDYDYMSVTRSDSVVVSGYPITYPFNRIVNNTVSVAPVSGVVYTVVCKSLTIPENISQDVYPKGGLLLSGNISGDVSGGTGNTASDDEVYVYATSTIGKFTGLGYVVSGADTWTVDKKVRKIDNSYITVRTNGSKNTIVSLSAADSDYYPYGAEWLITAVKGGVTKKLHLVLGTKFSPIAQIVSIVPLPQPLWSVNTYDVTINCKNSTSYEIYQNLYPGIAVPDGKLAGNFITTSNYTVTIPLQLNPPTATNWQVKLICKAGTDKDEKIATVVNPLMAPTKFVRFSTNPNSLVCTGGNTSLSWDIQYAKGKNCKITATTTTTLLTNDPFYNQKKASIDIANLYLNGNHASFSDGLVVTPNLTQSQALESQDSEFHSVGEFTRIPVRYGTRFIIECNSGRQRADVEVVCTGQQ